MSIAGGPAYDPDADFVYDYYTLRIGGLAFTGVLIILSIFLLTGNKLRRCGKSRANEENEPIKMLDIEEQKKDDED
ncbi:hypothetical protein DPEC_G00299730 [Dallia pectoralis]|uniref:Uncharacterized protein n=1 Tax=Dallia pectoralis TaxID=75939 RepID=A0ACC2FGA8_DALPE|nr:hypothetical protein DPEC_G00299730 [Dallia pectoralis]